MKEAGQVAAPLLERKRGKYSSRFEAGRKAGIEAGIALERADVLALLRRRRKNCLTIEARAAGMAEAAPVQRREIEVLIGLIEEALHEGEAEVAAELEARA